MNVKFLTRNNMRSLEITWLWEQAVKLAAELLGLEDDINSKHIRFSMVKNMTKFACGSCEANWDGDMAVDLGLKPEWVRIRVRENLRLECAVKTIGHEMVHAKQYLTQELTYHRMFRGKDYSDAAYEDRPWEKEAMEFEGAFWELFVERIDKFVGPQGIDVNKYLERCEQRW